jgi:hypothetical protein
MNDAKTIDISEINFTSTVFPTDADKMLWESLNPEQKLAVLRRDEQAAFESGVADHISMPDLLAEARRDTDQ